MTNITLDQIKALREATGAGVMDAKRALEDSDGDTKKAKQVLKEKGLAKAQKREGREVKAGIVESYIHATGTVGAIVALGSETDFVARTDEFKKLARELAMQIASMNPGSTEDLLNQEYIRNPGQKISDLINELIAKTGENIKVVDFRRLSLKD